MPAGPEWVISLFPTANPSAAICHLHTTDHVERLLSVVEGELLPQIRSDRCPALHFWQNRPLGLTPPSRQPGVPFPLKSRPSSCHVVCCDWLAGPAAPPHLPGSTSDQDRPSPAYTGGHHFLIKHRNQDVFILLCDWLTAIS